MATPVENPGYSDSTLLQRLAAVTQELKKRTTELLSIKLGDRVLDVGCGPGTDTVPMARLVGPDGLVVGIDYDVAMVEDANELAEAAAVAVWVRHELADALSLPYPSNTFDACRSERLFQHVSDCSSVLQEMVRVTKPRGKIAVADSDWCSLSIDTPEIEIERRVVRCITTMLRNGYAGRQLFRLFNQHHLTDIRVEVHPIVWTDYKAFRATSFSLRNLDRRLIDSGAVSANELRRFWASLEDAQQRGVFFASGNLVLVVGINAK